MDWFKQNKVVIGSGLVSIATTLKLGNTSQSIYYAAFLDILLAIGSAIAATGTSIKSDRQEKVTAKMKKTDPKFFEKRRY